MIYKFATENLRWIIGGVLIVLALWWFYSAITANPKAEARLGKNQTGAVLDSGRDAVSTVGAANLRENEMDRKVNDANSKVDAAPDAAGADAAGRDGLCGVSSDLCGK